MNISIVTWVHTITGITLVMAGAIALFSRKGSVVHRLAGKCFVALMLLLGVIVLVGAATNPGSVSSLGFLFVCLIVYLVLTSWYTMKKSHPGPDAWDYVAPVSAFIICCVGIYLGLEVLDNPIKEDDAPPVEAYFFFSALALLAMFLDLNNLRIKGVKGKHRKLRHLWRMCISMYISTATLFTGIGSFVFPESIRGSVYLTIPEVVVAAVALFWICKLVFVVDGGFLKRKPKVRP